MDDVGAIAALDACLLQPGGRPPLRAGALLHHLDIGAWSLLKGATWDPLFRGVVHRSPHRKAPRLLVSLDPIP